MEQHVINDISLTARILGAAFYYPPAEKSDIVELLSHKNWVAEWPYGSDDEKQSIATLLSQTSLNEETLTQAYQRLFIGPYALPAPPWGSVYLDNENVLFGNSTLDLREWMLEHGIDIALTQNEPEDHFGLIVMMVAWIAETRPVKLNELLAEHLLPWAYRYLEKMSLQSAFPYYEGLAMLATLTLKNWQSQLNVTPVEKQLFC
ncbi:Tat proofreading chaperone DmsD [Proteus myxofaciens]|uniref:Tat proofreading chaperone DmsD n=1 Tax=Proteus myxofaciens ATCC 19692 TaxID=1354337 RepID=A0A198GSM4_9GAMM|nr:Tat proofreading chaperone DmsD [Proteus myxofaciens]OAT39241.1 putative anaerobic dehydrogenase oxidoreductase component [Proteus myxofaciens ATCC 19692]